MSTHDTTKRMLRLLGKFPALFLCCTAIGMLLGVGALFEFGEPSEQVSQTVLVRSIGVLVLAVCLYWFAFCSWKLIRNEWSDYCELLIGQIQPKAPRKNTIHIKADAWLHKHWLIWPSLIAICGLWLAWGYLTRQPSRTWAVPFMVCTMLAPAFVYVHIKDFICSPTRKSFAAGLLCLVGVGCFGVVVLKIAYPSEFWPW